MSQLALANGCLFHFVSEVYVASICVHVNPQQAVRAMIEADAYAGRAT